MIARQTGILLLITLMTAQLALAQEQSNTIFVRKPDRAVPGLIMQKWTFQVAIEGSDTLSIPPHELNILNEQKVREMIITRTSIFKAWRRWTLSSDYRSIVFFQSESRVGFPKIIPDGKYSIEKLDQQELWLKKSGETTVVYKYRSAPDFD